MIYCSKTGDRVYVSSNPHYVFFNPENETDLHRFDTVVKVSDLAMAKDDSGGKIVHLKLTDRRGWCSQTTTYVGTNDYLKYICDGLNVEICKFSKTLYRLDDRLTSIWVNTLEDLP